MKKRPKRATRADEDRITVLVVAEGAQIREHLSLIVEQRGGGVLEAIDLEAAFNCLREVSKINWVMIRHGKENNGPQMVGEMKKAYPHLQIILIGGCETEVEALLIGATVFIPTPADSFKTDALTDALERLLPIKGGLI